ncbi:MAG TPA: nucleoside-triphosphatase [Aggregatilineales bacterium]|nr:hypothetical protein [Chloroflexota bacterium]HOA24914.1 nucleoside-triphosphatase [Aggregatilineales bacterium]HPV06960.1 nucleoside-triphosphatase [Aggregatilineales bacterium]HQA68558.1 nucleoside-triphosphatase [Aggregatilineales bacterium]
MMSATTPTPADLLARLLAEPPPRVALVTGDSGAGKTTWCRSLVEAARQRGLRVAGLLSPPVFEQGVKTGIDLLDLTTGERRRLAARRPVPDPDAAVRKWLFDDAVVDWANAVLRRVEACDVLLLDELGPLELLHNTGFVAALDLLESDRYRAGVVVVRPTLLAEAARRWPVAATVEITRG